MPKLKSTYVDALPAIVNPTTGRVHTSYNQTGTLRNRYELAGHYQIAALVRPSNQRLHGNYLAGSRIDQRLIVQDQLPLRYGFAKLFLQPEVLFGHCIHFLVVEAETGLAVGFRLVHGGVGIAHQRVRIGAR